MIFHNSFPFISFKYKTILVNMTKRSNLLSLRHFDYSFTHIFININADSFIIYGSVYMWTSPEPIRRFRLHRYWVLRDGHMHWIALDHWWNMWITSTSAACNSPAIRRLRVAGMQETHDALHNRHCKRQRSSIRFRLHSHNISFLHSRVTYSWNITQVQILFVFTK